MTVIASRAHYAQHMAPIDLDGLDVTLVASYADLVKARRLKRKRIVLMQHGIGQSYSNDHPCYAGGRDNDDVGLFLVPNDHAGARWQAKYPAARVEVVGSPRLDDLPQRIWNGDERHPTVEAAISPQAPSNVSPITRLAADSSYPTVAVTWHWDCNIVPECGSAFRYFREAVVELAKSYHVIGHGHPRAKRLEVWYRQHGIEWVPSFDDVCRRADVLIFDNTSAGYEFASTGRPVVVLNSPEYRLGIEHGLRFWDAVGVGTVASSPDYLATAVDRALMGWPEDVERREAALDIVYRYRTGAGQRSRDAIEDWAA